MDKKQKSIGKTIVNIVLWIFLGFAIIVTGLAIASNSSDDGIPTIGKTVMLSVQSNSMYKEDGSGFEEGDLIFARKLTSNEKSTLKVGDVVTFRYDIDGDGEKELDTHRIISIDEISPGFPRAYITKGDNVNIAETDTQTILCSEVIAVYDEEAKIAGLGKVVDFLKSSNGFLFCVVIPMGALFLYEVIAFTLTLSKYKNSKKQPAGFSKEEEELIKQKAIEEYLAKQKENKEE